MTLSMTTKSGDHRAERRSGKSDGEPSIDPVWDSIRAEVAGEVKHEPILASFLHATILRHNRLEDALSFHLAEKLGGPSLAEMLVREMIDEALAASPEIAESVRADLRAVKERDPATQTFSQPFLYFKGFQALQSYRIAHWLWEHRHKSLALFLQNRISQVFAVDIHPAARIGHGILIDHGTGVVIGETSVVENDVSMLHEVTLGGTGKETGDRHPKVREGVLIGAGAKILGNVEIGKGAKVGAGSVVLDDVPPHCTVAGVPARIVGCPQEAEPALSMNHRLPDNPGAGI
ncbi:MAG TPA: serine O-acetyltransferase [Planctomycetaceae bacterium]|jgi:serine O-acetyltransferase|nr:serine O-acetyltransferase [Planctomycetaceae bacterium]